MNANNQSPSQVSYTRPSQETVDWIVSLTERADTTKSKIDLINQKLVLFYTDGSEEELNFGQNPSR